MPTLPVSARLRPVFCSDDCQTQEGRPAKARLAGQWTPGNFQVIQRDGPIQHRILQPRVEVQYVLPELAEGMVRVRQCAPIEGLEDGVSLFDDRINLAARAGGTDTLKECA